MSQPKETTIIQTFIAQQQEVFNQQLGQKTLMRETPHLIEMRLLEKDIPNLSVSFAALERIVVQMPDDQEAFKVAVEGLRAQMTEAANQLLILCQVLLANKDSAINKKLQSTYAQEIVVAIERLQAIEKQFVTYVDMQEKKRTGQVEIQFTPNIAHLLMEKYKQIPPHFQMDLALLRQRVTSLENRPVDKPMPEKEFDSIHLLIGGIETLLYTLQPKNLDSAVAQSWAAEKSDSSPPEITPLDYAQAREVSILYIEYYDRLDQVVRNIGKAQPELTKIN